ncbi:MAG TPA: DUF5777 family beta-barrel protein [Cyclobacteriaceae bacterium]|jgi:hypothetical protein|nr:DUF5777 family beta-barrel protein [Cyclobacteriaceae bacterium]
MKKIFSILFLFTSICLYAQDDLMKELEQNQKPETNYITQTFKGTRIINGQSVETKGKGELEFIFSHRFDKISTGPYQVWGLDGYPAVRLGLEYGITDRLGVGIGRNFYYNNKMEDLYLRYKIARQSSGAKSFPVTITGIGTMMYQPYPNATDAANNNIPLPSTSERLSYVAELLIARKFSPKFSAQIAPTFVHRNAVDQTYENNDDIAVAFGGRFKFTRSLSLIGEYYWRQNVHANSPYYDAVGAGLDIETGGHVFQLIFTNSLGMNPNTIVTQTDTKPGDLRFGFNISRTFQLTKRK